jgi:sugar lactone lactonase YvrE
MDGAESVIAEGDGITSCNDVAVSTRGDIYFTDPPSHRVWYVDAKGNKRVVNEGLIFPNGVRFSVDESTLIVADSQSKWMWSFQVQPMVRSQGEPFYRLDTWDENAASAADGLRWTIKGMLRRDARWAASLRSLGHRDRNYQ